MKSKATGQIFQLGDFARCERPTGVVEGEVTKVENGKITIFDMLPAPGSRNLFELPAAICLRVPRGNYQPYSRQ